MQIRGIPEKISYFLKCADCLTRTPGRIFQRIQFFPKNAKFVISLIGGAWQNRRLQERCYFKCSNIRVGPRYSNIGIGDSVKRINSRFDPESD